MKLFAKAITVREKELQEIHAILDAAVEGIAAFFRQNATQTAMENHAYVRPETYACVNARAFRCTNRTRELIFFLTHDHDNLEATLSLKVESEADQKVYHDMSGKLSALLIPYSKIKESGIEKVAAEVFRYYKHACGIWNVTIPIRAAFRALYAQEYAQERELQAMIAGF